MSDRGDLNVGLDGNPRRVQSLRNGHSIHLGDKWYVARMPDSGRVYYSEDYGPGTREVDPTCVPLDVRLKAGERRV